MDGGANSFTRNSATPRFQLVITSSKSDPNKMRFDKSVFGVTKKSFSLGWGIFCVTPEHMPCGMCVGSRTPEPYASTNEHGEV